MKNIRLKKVIQSLAFAELIIKRKVIDYIRKEARTAQHINMDVQEGDDQESSQSLIEAELSIDEYRKQIEQEQRREEILFFQKRLKEYGLSFKESAGTIAEAYRCEAECD